MHNREDTSGCPVDIITQVIHLPVQLHVYENRNVSLYRLFQNTGYAENHHRISVEGIEKALLDNEPLIQRWFDYSSDKRADEGYCLEKINNVYKIGYLKNRKVTVIDTYNSRADACAHFIKMELEFLRKR